MNLDYWVEQIRATTAIAAHLAIPAPSANNVVYLPVVAVPMAAGRTVLYLPMRLKTNRTEIPNP